MTKPHSPATVYTGPVSTVEVAVAGRHTRLVRPAEPDRLLDAPEVLAWNRLDDYMPYWAYLWPGAFLLAEAVAREPWIAGTPALEIGCGLGLAGLVGLSRGLRVVFSDYDPTPLEFVARSALANGHAADAFATLLLDFREPSGERFPVILGADVLYEARLAPMVANLLAGRLAEGGLALIADPFRVAAQGFPATVSALGLSCESVAVSASSEELGPLQGTLHRVSRPLSADH